jgi:hypothetical protein
MSGVHVIHPYAEGYDVIGGVRRPRQEIGDQGFLESLLLSII